MEDLPELTVSEVRGLGRKAAESDKSNIAEEFIDYAKKCKFDLVVRDELAEAVVDVTTRTAHTGHPGDGLIFVSPVEEVIKIRTGERRHQP
ncbi:MAG: P-II family nitrogen regulator [Chloroflexi bacterium]|nr:P-II family nitrogen regulator [Chloroflexota bacterium]